MANKSITEVMQEHRSTFDGQATDQIADIEGALNSGGDLHDTVATQMTDREASRSNFENDVRNSPEFKSAPAEHQKTMADVFAEADKANAAHEQKNEALSKPPANGQPTPGQNQVIAREAVGNIRDGQAMQQDHFDKLKVEVDRIPERIQNEKASLEANLRDKTNLGQAKTPIDQKGHDRAVQAEICRQVSLSEGDGRNLSKADIAYKELAKAKSEEGLPSQAVETISDKPGGKNGGSISHTVTQHAVDKTEAWDNYNKAVKAMSPAARKEHNEYTAKMEAHAKDMVKLDGKEAGVANNSDTRVSNNKLPFEIRADAAKDLKQYEDRLANNPNHQPSKIERAQMDLLAHKATEKDPSMDSRTHNEQRANLTAQFNREYLKSNTEEKVAFHKDREVVTGKEDPLLKTRDFAAERSMRANQAEKMVGEGPATGLDKLYRDAKVAEAKYGEGSKEAIAANKDYAENKATAGNRFGRILGQDKSLADHEARVAQAESTVKSDIARIEANSKGTSPSPATPGAAPNAVPPPAGPGATPVNAAISAAAATPVNAAPVTPPPAAAPVTPAAGATTPPPATATPATTTATPPPAASVAGGAATPTATVASAPPVANTTTPSTTAGAPANATPGNTNTPAPGNANGADRTREEVVKDMLKDASTSAVKEAVSAEKIKDVESGANIFGGQNAAEKPSVADQLSAAKAEYEAKIAEIKSSPEFKAEVRESVAADNKVNMSDGPEPGKTLSGHDIPGGSARGENKPGEGMNEGSYKNDQTATSTSPAPETDKMTAPSGLDGKGEPAHSPAPETNASDPASGKPADAEPVAKAETVAPEGTTPQEPVAKAETVAPEGTSTTPQEPAAKAETVAPESATPDTTKAESSTPAADPESAQPKSYEELLAENEALKSENEALQSKVGELEGKNETLEQANTELSVENKDVGALADQLWSEKDALSEKNETLEQDKSELSGKVEDLTAENGAQKEEIGSLTQDKAELGEKADSLSSENVELKEENGGLKNEIQEKDAEIESLKAELDATKDHAGADPTTDVAPTDTPEAVPSSAPDAESAPASDNKSNEVDPATVAAAPEEAVATTAPGAESTASESVEQETVVAGTETVSEPVSQESMVVEVSTTAPENSTTEPRPENLKDAPSNETEAPSTVEIGKESESQTDTPSTPDTSSTAPTDSATAVDGKPVEEVKPGAGEGLGQGDGEAKPETREELHASISALMQKQESTTPEHSTQDLADYAQAQQFLNGAANTVLENGYNDGPKTGGLEADNPATTGPANDDPNSPDKGCVILPPEPGADTTNDPKTPEDPNTTPEPPEIDDGPD